MSAFHPLLRWLALFAAAIAFAPAANAQKLTWQLEELYSNQDGTIEFIVVSEYAGNNNQQGLGGAEFSSIFGAASHGHGAGDVTTFAFPADLPSSQTAGKKFLVASQGFANLKIITPDYITPDRFMASAAGTLRLYKSVVDFDRIDYPGLPQDGATGLFRISPNQRPNIATNFAGQTASVPATPAGLPTGTAVEYYYAAWNYYFITAFPEEQAVLDGGAFGGVWKRTGESFKVWTQGSATSPAACRFFSVNPNFVDTDGTPKSSHFYTPYSAECASLKTNPDWQFEDVAFYMQLTDTNGNCPAGSVPLYRAYNNGMGGAPNHRFTTNPAVLDQMISAGWVFEGDGRTRASGCVPG